VGKKCRYDGRDMARQHLVELQEAGEVLDVCPEELGGLPTPRMPAERVGVSVITNEKLNITREYNLGAELVMNLIADLDIEKAYLKSKSPMCGCGQIYDGSFTGRLKEGDGILVELLKARTQVPIESIE
jgi:uncharacterized protein YbbK (DUF523 family)